MPCFSLDQNQSVGLFLFEREEFQGHFTHLSCLFLADSQEHIGVSRFSIVLRTSDGKKSWRALTPVYSWLLSYLDEFVLSIHTERLPNYKCVVKYTFWKAGTERSRALQAPRSLHQRLWASKPRPREWSRCVLSPKLSAACWSHRAWSASLQETLRLELVCFGRCGLAHPKHSPLFHSASQGHSGYSVVLEKMKIQVWEESRPPKNREGTTEIWNKLAKLPYIFFSPCKRRKTWPERTRAPSVHRSTVCRTQDTEASRTSTDRGTGEGVPPSCMMDYYAAQPLERVSDGLCSSVGGPENIRGRGIWCGVLTREIQTNGTEELICKTEQTHRHRDKTHRHRRREWTHGSQQGRLGGMHRWGVWEDMYTLVYFTWITTKDKLHSAGNTAQDSIIT